MYVWECATEVRVRETNIGDTSVTWELHLVLGYVSCILAGLRQSITTAGLKYSITTAGLRQSITTAGLRQSIQQQDWDSSSQHKDWEGPLQYQDWDSHHKSKTKTVHHSSRSSWSHYRRSQEADGGESWHLANWLLFIQSETLAYGLVLPKVKMGLTYPF
jgi:hypothetical protein